MLIRFQPQHSLPDVFLWMLVDKKRVAYYRFPARSILNATTDDQRGKHCGKMQTIFLRVTTQILSLVANEHSLYYAETW
jgi:hypothetical protein